MTRAQPKTIADMTHDELQRLILTVDQRQSQVAAVVEIPLKPVAGFAPYSGGMA
ncbi:MAG: hypothetical protein ACUVSU_15405 [Aggregatilineaceae bacterium]